VDRRIYNVYFATGSSCRIDSKREQEERVRACVCKARYVRAVRTAFPKLFNLEALGLSEL